TSRFPRLTLHPNLPRYARPPCASGTSREITGEVGSGFLRFAQDDTKKFLTGRSPHPAAVPILFPVSPGAGAGPWPLAGWPALKNRAPARVAARDNGARP